MPGGDFGGGGSHTFLSGPSDVAELKGEEWRGRERQSMGGLGPSPSQPRCQNELKIVATRLPSVSRPHMVA